MTQLQLTDEVPDKTELRKDYLTSNIQPIIHSLNERLRILSNDEKIAVINEIKIALHDISPMKNEPVDCVLWVKNNEVQANDYNPNSVAPPEMELLKVSITEDGYTQPIVTFYENTHYTVVDGFHRNRVGKECKEVCDRVKGYLPVTIIRPDREGRNDRIASTIRHNRARGKHSVTGMSDIVLELKNRNWTNERIAKELGMDQDEILRLCQITGLAGLFSDQTFSKSWDIEDSTTDFTPITEEFDLQEGDNFRTVNTNDDTRIFHTFDTWECYKAGLYATTFKGLNKEECEQKYATFLSDDAKFIDALEHIIAEWKHSCEHYLTNASMNRIAWLGQAAMCYSTGIPAVFRGGFNLLSKEQQDHANEIAFTYLNKWLVANGKEQVTLEVALSGKQMELY